MRTRIPTAAVLGGASCFVSAGLALGLGAIVVLLALDSSYDPAHSLPSSLPDVFMALAFALVGAILTIRRPGNLVGWALSLAGAGLLFGGILSAYSELALLAKPGAELPAGAAAAAIAEGSWTPLMAGVFLLLLLFPTGRVPSPRWRPVTGLVLLGFAVIWTVISTAPGHLDPRFEAYENPLAVTESERYVFLIFPVIAVCLVCVGLAAINLLLRFRRSRGGERQQFKWLAGGAGFLLLTLPFGAAFNFSAVAGAAFSAALIALPVSVGIAVLRYRLYDIDRIISRTLTYGLLTAGLGSAYLGLVVGLQALLRPISGGSDLAIAGTTLVIAALFLPARRRVQSAVERRFSRRAYDAASTIDTFSARLRREIGLESLTAELSGVVLRTMQPAHVSLWLRNEEPRR